MPIISYFPLGGGSGGVSVPLDDVTNIDAIAGSGEAYIKWADPGDVIYEGEAVSTWKGTKLVRKGGSYPKTPIDGKLVVDSTTHNQYSGVYLKDVGLANGQTYYYKFFPYNHKFAYTNTDEGQFEITPTPIYLDGVSDLVASPGFEKVTIKWTNPGNIVAEESTDVTLAQLDHIVIVYNSEKYPESIDDGVAYTIQNSAVSEYVAEGLTNGTTYYFSLFPVSTAGDISVDEGSRVAAMPQKITIEGVPSQSGTLTYTGNEQSPIWSNYDSAHLIIGGITSATDAGIYEATFTPTENAMWEDGTSTTKRITWAIDKADGSLTFSAQYIPLDSEGSTQWIEIWYVGDGVVSVESSDTTIATVTVDGTMVTISSPNQKNGTAIITARVSGSKNYTTPANATCEVTAIFLPGKDTLESMSWGDISAVCKAGKADEYWKIGDEKTVSYDDSDIVVRIIGFYHDDLTDAENYNADFAVDEEKIGKAGITFQTVECVTSERMESSTTNANGWHNSRMRKSVLPKMLNKMSEPNDYIVSVIKTTGYGSQQTVTYEVNDKLFLLSLAEVEGYSDFYIAPNEGFKYEYYELGNPRKKESSWWLRSPYINNSTSFCCITTSGTISTSEADYYRGVAFAFCV